ncbi:C6 finger domain protein [Tolypocladium capitatum]|uniref:C6 finger domain protein n=1 Tax=Tolypocladium capitatum TaxID=45235 RepID=A0A2K3QF27_9HYPO|nr:C6 finger domain protein [Tolypocladium capitatum]
MPCVRDRSAGDSNDDDTEASPSAASAAAAAASRRRRSHRKSRNGCAECKRRHIRCDEQRPVCAHCAIAQRTCLFPPLREEATRSRRREGEARHGEPRGQEPRGQGHESPPHAPSSHHDPGGAAEMTGQSPGTDPDRPSVGQGTPSVPPSLPSFDEAFPPHPPHESAGGAEHDAAALFTAQHLALLHHAETIMDDSITIHGRTKQLIDIAVRRAADAPYLIDQVLALSALHLATTTCQQDPQSSAASSAASSASSLSSPPSSSPSPSTLRHQATRLQTRAVACFTRHTRSVPADDAASALPRFLFAATLNLHVLAETLAEVRHLHHSRFHVFVDRFAECLRLHRGIRAVIGPTWQDLLKSEFEPLLTLTRDAHNRAEPNGAGAAADDGRPPDECAHLLALLDASDLGPSTAHTCREAVHRLQWAFNLYSNLGGTDGGPHAASAFSVTIGADYVDVLCRHQPEALVILAHYGVLLHRCRHFWVFGDAGACMIRAIAQHLGNYWRDAVAWPLQVLQSEHG